MQFVVHAGPHKTATTYLQWNFNRRRRELLQRGWLYPSLGESLREGHRDISGARAEVGGRNGRAFRDLQRIAAEAHRARSSVLISGEGFRSWNVAEYGAMAGTMGPRALHVVYTLRDPLTSIHSTWAQFARMGVTTRSLPNFVARHVGRPLKSRILNPLSEVAPIRDGCGARCTLLLYDEIVRRKQDIFEAFLEQALGIAGVPPAPHAPANARREVELTEFIRLFAKRNPQFKGTDGANVGEAFSMMLSKRELADIVGAVRSDGASARRELAVSRRIAAYDDLDAELKRAFPDDLKPFPENGRIFPDHDENWTYYDEQELVRIPAVAALLETVERKLAFGSARVGLASFAKRIALSASSLKNRFLP